MFFFSVFYEPTDVPVAAKPFQCPSWKSLKFISPNLNELKYIAKELGLNYDNQILDPVQQASQIGKLVSKYVDTLLITMGSLGLIIIRKAEASEPLLKSTQILDEPLVRFYKTKEVTDLVNVSGAGDCLASGIIIAMLKGKSEEVCVSVGFAAAKMALQSKSAVPNVMFDDNHGSWNQKAEYIRV